MVKSIVSSGFYLSLAVVSCEAQLNNIPKRFRQNIVFDEEQSSNKGARKLSTNEFGRRAYEMEMIERQLEFESESSMSFSMRRLEESSLSMDYSMSMKSLESEEPDVEIPDAESSSPTIQISILALFPVAWFML
ncbi:hypothetical protein ACHAXS_003527 [Conticribra weissflogii]